MALSGSYNYYTTRDDIIKRALRIVGAIAQGETPATAAVTEASITLNELLKEWQADGMQLWKYNTVALSGISTGITVTIGMSGQNVTAAPFMKLLGAYYRNTDSGADTPLIVITKEEYDRLSPKATTGTPSQVYYQPPRVKDSAVASGNSIGTFYFHLAPSTAWLADNTIYATGILPLQDFDASTDNPDLPDYMVNSLVWGLADQLAYEYGVALPERDRITKKAMYHKAVASSFDQEEGSIYIIPQSPWEA